MKIFFKILLVVFMLLSLNNNYSQSCNTGRKIALKMHNNQNGMPSNVFLIYRDIYNAIAGETVLGVSAVDI